MAGTEKVGIEIELTNAEEAYKTLRNIDETVKSIGRKKTMIKLDDGSLVSIDERIKEIQDKLAAVRSSKNGEIIDHGEVKTAKDLNNELRILKQGLKDATANSKTFAQTFNSISSKVAHIGSAMQSFGNAVTRLASPFSRLMNGVVLGAGFKVLNSFTEGFERGFTRYDTMKKYPKIMAAFGYSAAESEKSIKALDLSVRGLPTGLDEMVDLAQRFIATTGDMDKGTKLAIATNNAFLASMSTDTQRYQGMMQLQDVLGGKDMNAREWNSLVSSMTPAIVKMGEAMKESGKWSGSIGEFIQHVRDGKMDNQEFINQLIAIGNKGGSLEKMAQESKNTWQAFFANVGNAASRMTAGIIESMDEIVKSLNLTDKDGVAIDSVNMLLSKKFIPAIDNTTESIKKWIKAHPEEIKQFFKDLSKIDFKSLARGFAQGLGDLAKIIHTIAKLLGGKDLSLIGRFFGNGRFIGGASTIIGGLLKGLRHPLAGIGAVLIHAGKWIENKALGKVGKAGIFGKIASFFGKKKDIVDAGKAAGEIPTVASTFKRAFSALEGLIKAAGAVLIVGTTGFIAFKEVKSILKDVDEIGEILKGMDWVDAAIGTDVALGITVLTKAFEAIGSAIGPGGLLNEAIAGASALVVGGTLAGMAWEVKTTLDQIKQTIVTFQEIANELSTFETPEIDGKAILRTIAQINAIYGAISGQGSGGGVGSVLGFLKNPLGSLVGGLAGGAKRAVDASSIASKYASMLEAIKSLKAIASQMNSLAGMKIAEGIDGTISKIASVVDTVYASFPKLTMSKSGATNLETGTSSLANALGSIQKMARKINKLAGTDLNTSGFSAFIESLKTALTDLQSLAGLIELDIEVKLSDKFGTSVTNAVNEIKKGKDKIKKQKSGVSFTIPVSVTFAVTTNFGAALAGIINQKNELSGAGSGGSSGGSSGGNSGGRGGRTGHKSRHQRLTGGYIYRANGGSIGFPGKPQGADRIPVWASAGEYIHNKRAVNTFGIDFMRKVNNLDVKGAMNELMHRAGGMANVNRGVSITNNNYNNQKVTINNSNNAGAGFTFKSASRFVGAF